MIKELIVLADELDKYDEKEAADFVDKLVKMAAGEPAEEVVEEEQLPELKELSPLTPEADEFDDSPPTVVDFWSKTGKELVAKLMHFFRDNPEPMKWSEDARAKVIEAMEVLLSGLKA